MDINAELVRNGYAWVYRRYAKDKTLYKLETEARENQLGLWALPEEQKIAPWEWRQGKRNIIEHEATSFKCGSKKYCKEMANCEEAIFYLKTCNLSRLDRDKDGIPCESLCR